MKTNIDNQNRLDDAIFISGAGQRVGFYVAKQFLQTTHFPVVFSYYEPHAQVDELVKLGGIGFQADFTDLDGLEHLVSQIKANVSSLRAVIHNASVWLDDEQAPVNSAAYHSLFQLHVDAPIYLNEALYPLLMNSVSTLKDIISLSDFSVAQPKAETVAYLASKAALQNLAQNYALKFAPDIKVNDIAPGLIRFNEWDDEVCKAKRLAQNALPFEPREEVLWQAIQYVMNSPYTTGVSVPVNGGSHLL